MTSSEGSSPLTRGRPSTVEEPHSRPGAHPRSRGVDGERDKISSSSSGSSPLTRGRLVGRVPGDHDTRLIPAHAGSTCSRLAAPWFRTAHPRSRGVDPDRSGRRFRFRGSSPLTRGRRWLGTGRHARRGLIPAHAGSTPPHQRTGRPSRAHPRSRGVDSISARQARGTCGSSPLTRGRRDQGNRHRRYQPAHPRSRGVDGVYHGEPVPSYGSSPLTRGRREALVPLAVPARLIPAHAGSTLLWRPGRRVRGGSSPLTRGRRAPVHRSADTTGLIPAHAGSTWYGSAC